MSPAWLNLTDALIAVWETQTLYKGLSGMLQGEVEKDVVTGMANMLQHYGSDAKSKEENSPNWESNQIGMKF